MRRAGRWVSHHRYAIAGVIFAVSIAGVVFSQTREIDRNERQDAVDRDRTAEVAGILHQLADIIEQQEVDRVEGCERGNAIRRQMHALAAQITDDAEVLALVEQQLPLEDCHANAPPAPPRPSTTPAEVP